jgi:DNA polymerase-1
LDRAVASKQVEALNFEMELVPVFARMSFNGMPISLKKLKAFLGAQSKILKQLKPEFEKEFGTINPGSWQQVAKVFKDRGINIPNTRKETMIDLAQHGGEPGRLAELLLTYRKPAQRLKMYRPEWVEKHVVGGRAHPRFWQCSTDTTRVASSDPNLQQVPRDMRDPWGWEDGVKIVAADYSQIEVRIAAYKANDETLIALLENEDAHTAIAAEVNGCRPEDVTKEMRKAAKAETFTLLFGGGPDTLYQYARLQGSLMTEPEARAMVQKFFQTFKGLARMRSWAENLGQTRNHITLNLPAGHKRVLRGNQVRSTIILNTLVQGSAATGIKYAMLECRARGLDKYLSIQVHDELVAAVPNNEAAEYARELEEAMKVGMAKVLPTTVKVETKIGDSWQ